MKLRIGVVALLMPLIAQASIFGEESVPLWKLVSGQILELERLAKIIGVSEESRDFLVQLNSGVERVTEQIEAIESVIERAQGLDPRSVRDLSSLNQKLLEMKGILESTEQILSLKISLCNQAISQSALQSETAYKMGQEMIGTGAQLASESKTASPGRAGQIAASAASAQMLATGVQLQTIAQLTQLQALSLELQKSQSERELRQSDLRRTFLARQLPLESRGGR